MAREKKRKEITSPKKEIITADLTVNENKKLGFKEFLGILWGITALLTIPFVAFGGRIFTRMVRKLQRNTGAFPNVTATLGTNSSGNFGIFCDNRMGR